MGTTTITTEAAGERIAALDVVRGLAVMGILLINIVGFAMPEAAYVNPAAWGGTEGADLVVFLINQILFEGRMRGLFALLFGASTLLIMDRAEAAGRSPEATHLRRMAALALFGAAHLYLVWDGDILLHYAVLGALLWLLRDWRPRALAAGAAALGIAHALYWTLLMLGILALDFAASQPGAAADLVAQAREVRKGFPGPGNPTVTRELAVFRGSYADILTYRFEKNDQGPIGLLTVIGGETLAYMLLGMALMKSGFFTGGWSRAALRRTAIVCHTVSLPFLALFTWWGYASGFDPVVMLGNFLAWSVPFRILSAVGHLALAMLIIGSARGWLAGHIGAAGRMAFTNYLATSLVMTTIFYGYGLGLFGSVGRAELYLFVLAMWVAMLLWSKAWLDRYRYGPFEWLWRSLATLSPQPMRRGEAA